MSNVINSEDIKVKVSGSFGSLFSKTNITIGATDKFVYKEVSQGRNSGTKIFPQNRIDSYGIEVFQERKYFLYTILFLLRRADDTGRRHRTQTKIRFFC